jgi:Zn-dependent alcohol dehydrogenase
MCVIEGSVPKVPEESFDRILGVVQCTVDAAGLRLRASAVVGVVHVRAGGHARVVGGGGAGLVDIPLVAQVPANAFTGRETAYEARRAARYSGLRGIVHRLERVRDDATSVHGEDLAFGRRGDNPAVRAGRQGRAFVEGGAHGRLAEVLLDHAAVLHTGNRVRADHAGGLRSADALAGGHAAKLDRGHRGRGDAGSYIASSSRTGGGLR